jgi:N-acetylglucosamine kinase-like BadF-type ATPase
VADLASQGDESAVKILQAAIMELAQLVRATQQKLSPKIRDVIAMGGLLENNRAFTDALAKELSGFSFKVAEVKPVEGAVAIAMKSAQSLSQPK